MSAPVAEPVPVDVTPGSLVAASDAADRSDCDAVCLQRLVGRYDSTWGAATFEVEGSDLLVRYGRGSMRCRVGARSLDCAWQEGAATGRARFVRASDDRLEGSWGNGASADDGGAWIFTRGGSRPAPDGFGGVYDTNYGPVRLVQQGDEVRGAYDRGSLACRAAGATLACAWAEGDAVGRARLTRTPDGSLEGTWGHGESADDGGAWTFVRR